MQFVQFVVCYILLKLTLFNTGQSVSQHDNDSSAGESIKESVSVSVRAGFNYVVNPPEIPRVAFGSSLERVTLPLSGPCLTSFMRQHQGDVYLSPGPTARVDERDFLKLGWPSKLGYAVLISKTPRLPAASNSTVPCVGVYNVTPHKIPNKAHKPFNIGAPLKDKQKFLTPSPTTYPHHLPRRQLKITTAFGSQRKIHPYVTIICTPLNMAQCSKCEQIPTGDYWHDFDTDLDLCRPCMHGIEQELRSCKTTEVQRLRLRREFGNYRQVRYCNFYHDHGGTMAAVQFLPKRILQMKTNRENYLSLYM